MAKPKKIKDVMPAPERRDLVALAMQKRAQKSGAFADKRQRKSVDWRKENW